MDKMEIDKKRKRVNFYKRFIITSIFAAILIPIVMCVVLFLKIHSLEKKVDGMQQAITEYRQDTEEKISDLQKKEAERTEKQTGREDVSLLQEKEPDTEVALPLQQEEEEPDTEENLKKVYLTFDDGPSANTDEILDILARYHVKATFFVVGKTDEVSRAAYKRIVEEGHTLGMHSYSHVYDSVYSSREAFEEDMLRLQSYLYQETGISSCYYRFPGGSSNTISHIDMQEFIACLHERGVEYYDWNVSNGDGAGKILDVDTLVENVMKDVDKFQTPMVLMHDDANKHSTVESLETIIQKLTEQGYVLRSIDDEVRPVQHVRPEE